MKETSKSAPVVLGAAVALSIATAIFHAISLSQASGSRDWSDMLWGLLGSIFLVSGALIVSRQPRNPIGWILILPGLSVMLGTVVDASGILDRQPDQVTWLIVAVIWIHNFGWLLMMYPIFHLLLVFPSGRLITPRWRWLVWLEALMLLFLGLTSAFTDRIGPEEVAVPWTVENPIGLVSGQLFETAWFGSIWTSGLLVLTLSGVVAISLRFRRSTGIERQQLKWLLMAVIYFAIVYVIAAVSTSWVGGLVQDALFVLGLASIPIAITVSVLRYRLFDIDYLIRRTVTYAVVVALLGAMLAFAIAGLAIFLPSDDPFVVAVATLLVAALFNPVRRRVRLLVDRRFNRTRYNQAQVLDDFASSMQDRVDLEGILGSWTGVVETTMHPSSIGIWTKP